MPETLETSADLRQIRQNIEHAYREALHAYSVLERYLSKNGQTPQAAGSEGLEPRKEDAQPASGKSQRALVQAAIYDKALSAKKIAIVTGLSEEQVRGVLYDPGFRDKVKKIKVLVSSGRQIMKFSMED